MSLPVGPRASEEDEWRAMAFKRRMEAEQAIRERDQARAEVDRLRAAVPPFICSAHGLSADDCSSCCEFMPPADAVREARAETERLREEIAQRDRHLAEIHAEEAAMIVAFLRDMGGDETATAYYLFAAREIEEQFVTRTLADTGERA